MPLETHIMGGNLVAHGTFTRDEIHYSAVSAESEERTNLIHRKDRMGPKQEGQKEKTFVEILRERYFSEALKEAKAGNDKRALNKLKSCQRKFGSVEGFEQISSAMLLLTSLVQIASRKMEDTYKAGSPNERFLSNVYARFKDPLSSNQPMFAIYTQIGDNFIVNARAQKGQKRFTEQLFDDRLDIDYHTRKDIVKKGLEASEHHVYSSENFSLAGMTERIKEYTTSIGEKDPNYKAFAVALASQALLEAKDEPGILGDDTSERIGSGEYFPVFTAIEIDFTEEFGTVSGSDTISYNVVDVKRMKDNEDKDTDSYHFVVDAIRDEKLLFRLNTELSLTPTVGLERKLVPYSLSKAA